MIGEEYCVRRKSSFLNTRRKNQPELQDYIVLGIPKTRLKRHKSAYRKLAASGIPTPTRKIRKEAER